jgi:PAS domain S-box-containing protein
MLAFIDLNIPGTCAYRTIYHRDGRIECAYVSPSIEALIGVSAAQFQDNAAHAFIFVHPDDLLAFRENQTRAIEAASAAEITVRVRLPSGRENWAQFRSQVAEVLGDGAQVRDGVVVDVTAAKIAENELRSVRERLELALRASRTCIWENHVEANQVTLDARWAEMRGQPSGPTVTTARELIALAHPDDRQAVFSASIRAIRGETDDYQVEQRIATVEGAWVWIMSIGQVTARDERGRAVRMVGTNTDITARKLAEEKVRQMKNDLEGQVADRTKELAASAHELAKSERLYRNLIEDINQGYFVTDRRSIITYCSPAVVSVSGLQLREILGRSCFRLVAAEDRPRVIATYAEWTRSRVADATIEFRLAFPKGKLIWLEQSSVFVRDVDGELIEVRNSVRDITERRAAETLLRQSNDRFHAVFERSPIMIGLLSVPEGRLVEVNAAGVAAFGYSREEAIGRTTLELKLWADPADRERYLSELCKSGHVAGCEARMRRKDGELFTVLYSGSIIEIGGQTFSLNSLQDISARRQSEAALRVSEERLGFALNATNDGLWDWNIPTGEVHFSQQWCRLLGYSHAEVPGRVEFFFSALHPDDVPQMRRALDDHLAGRTPLKQNEVRLRTKEGDYLWFHDRGKIVVWDDAGLPLRMVGTITAIAERKEAEAAIARSVASLRATLESTADGILTIGHDRRIGSFNRRFVEMWRIPVEVLAAKNDERALQFVLGQLVDPEAFLAKVRFLYDHADQESFDVLDFHDGRVFERYSRPMIVDGLPAGRVWSFRDVTERKQAGADREKLQARLHQNQKFEALGTLAGGVAHDFNNILTGVINYMSIAREDCPPGHPAIRKYLDEAIKGSFRAKELVRQILLFSRSEETVRVPVKVAEVVDEVLSMLRATLPANIVIEAELERDIPCILANSTQIHQVLMNLCINGAQAMQSRGGRLSVKLSVRMVDAAWSARLQDVGPGEYVWLEIADTGGGIDPAVFARIFEPFFTTKKVGEGTGLGLAVTRSVVQNHHGAISVQTQPGDGTTFELFFPVIAETLPKTEAAEDERPRGQGQRILLVDDEPMVTMTMKIHVERLGYLVTTTNLPEEALRQFEAAPGNWDLLITDSQMPGMNGIELIQRVLTRRPKMPVFVLTGHAGKITSEEMRSKGVLSVIGKPVDMTELANLLAKTLANR